MFSVGKRDAATLKHWPGGTPPFGYKLQSVLKEVKGCQEVDHRILVPNPGTAWIMQRFCTRRRNGLGPSSP